MGRASLWCLFFVVGACAPIEGMERFDGELAAAKDKRRIVALASPT